MVEEKVLKLVKLIQSHKVRYIPANLRLFIISEKEYLRITNRGINSSWHTDDFGIGETFRCEREHILDLFAKLEFFVNEIIRLKLLGWENPNHQMLEEILEYTDFFSRIKLLNNWGIIDKKLLGLLVETKQTRNGLAHKWSVDEVNYKGVQLIKNFEKFKEDMKLIWKGLLECYKGEQEKIDFDKLIKELEDLNSQEPDTQHPKSNTLK